MGIESSMMRKSTCVFGLVLGGLMGVSLLADTIQLKSGHKVQGEILKETEQEVYVDIGVDVVRIPVDRILSREVGDGAQAPSNKSAADGGGDEVFRTANLPFKSVKELAEEYGEGVVMVENPGGLGSGFIINERGYCVTNYHVVERETRLAVVIFDKTEAGDFVKRRITDVKIVAMNPYFDLALLQIPAVEGFKFTTVASLLTPIKKKATVSLRLAIHWASTVPCHRESSAPALAILRGLPTSRPQRRSTPATAVDRCSIRGAR